MFETGQKVRIIQNLEDFVDQDVNDIGIVNVMLPFAGTEVTIARVHEYFPTGNGDEVGYYYRIVEDRGSSNWPEDVFIHGKETNIEYYLIVFKDSSRRPISFRKEDFVDIVVLPNKGSVIKAQPTVRFV
jgi:hypothetical protein